MLLLVLRVVSAKNFGNLAALQAKLDPKKEGKGIGWRTVGKRYGCGAQTWGTNKGWLERTATDVLTPETLIGLFS